MNFKVHWKAIPILVVVVVLISSTLTILAQPVETKGVVYGTLGFTKVTVGPAANSSVNFLAMINILNSSTSNLISGSVTSNATHFSIYVLTLSQYLFWTEESFNSSNKATNHSATISKGSSISTGTEVVPWIYLYGATGNGTIHISWKMSPESIYVIVLISNARVFTFEQRLIFYTQYLQY
ncbi:MAG: hypothetical protein M0Z77_07850 [Thermoplasmatales archaeon]|nr:hypothetical protein [Thermoplasmatales archaeon]